MYRRTMRTGIIVGIAGIVIMLLTNTFMQNIGTFTYNGANVVFYAITQIYLLVPVACMPYSAALVSAALVMRHLDTAGAGRSRREPADENRT